MLNGINSANTNAAVNTQAIQTPKRVAVAAPRTIPEKLAAPAATQPEVRPAPRDTARTAPVENNTQIQQVAYSKRGQNQTPRATGNRLDVKA